MIALVWFDLGRFWVLWRLRAVFPSGCQRCIGETFQTLIHSFHCIAFVFNVNLLYRIVIPLEACFSGLFYLETKYLIFLDYWTPLRRANLWRRVRNACKTLWKCQRCSWNCSVESRRAQASCVWRLNEIRQQRLHPSAAVWLIYC